MNVKDITIITPSMHGRLQLTVVFKALELSRSRILDSMVYVDQGDVYILSRLQGIYSILWIQFRHRAYTYYITRNFVLKDLTLQQGGQRDQTRWYGDRICFGFLDRSTSSSR